MPGTFVNLTQGATMAKRKKKSKEGVRRENEGEESKKFAILLAVIFGLFVLMFAILQFI